RPARGGWARPTARGAPVRQPAGTVHVIPDAVATSSGAGSASSGPAGAGAAGRVSLAAAAGPLEGGAAGGVIERRDATKPSTRIATSGAPPIHRIMFESL